MKNNLPTSLPFNFNKMTHKIELDFEELCLVERALELYGRIGMYQFEYLTLNNSLQKQIWDKDISQEFRDKADELKALFGYPKNANPGILNKEEVSDDCRIAIHIYQQIRHQRYLDRAKINPQEEAENHGVYKYPANTCQLADMSLPNFIIKIY
jgi:hypothetical protein